MALTRYWNSIGSVIEGNFSLRPQVIKIISSLFSCQALQLKSG
jgi:hypothetical protein